MYCFIAARCASERLPNKHFLEMGSGWPLARHVEMRCRHFGMIPVYCVPADDVGDFDQHVGCTVYGGDPDNVEARMIECAHGLDVKMFHHLDGDDPWFDELSILRSMHVLMHSNVARVRPSYESQAGSGRVGTSYSLASNAKGEAVLYEEGRIFPWPQRLTLDYSEDAYLILAVERMVGSYMAPRAVVDDLFMRNPDLHKINWFRNAEWKERQLREGQSERPSSGVRT